jgi:hypothetical protein
MKKLIIVGIAATITLAVEHPIRQDLIDSIKAKTSMWEPLEIHENPFASLSADEMRGRLGLELNPIPHHYLKTNKPSLNAGNIPDDFDSRIQWQGCVHEIRFQK